MAIYRFDSWLTALRVFCHSHWGAVMAKLKKKAREVAPKEQTVAQASQM